MKSGLQNLALLLEIRNVFWKAFYTKEGSNVFCLPGSSPCMQTQIPAAPHFICHFKITWYPMAAPTCSACAAAAEALSWALATGCAGIGKSHAQVLYFPICTDAMQWNRYSVKFAVLIMQHIYSMLSYCCKFPIHSVSCPESHVQSLYRFWIKALCEGYQAQWVGPTCPKYSLPVMMTGVKWM